MFTQDIDMEWNAIGVCKPEIDLEVLVKDLKRDARPNVIQASSWGMLYANQYFYTPGNNDYSLVEDLPLAAYVKKDNPLWSEGGVLKS